VEDLAPIQMEEETASGLRSDTVGALDAPRYSLPVNGRNGDTPIGYSDQLSLAEIES
jgi:hypothetical protein